MARKNSKRKTQTKKIIIKKINYKKFIPFIIGILFFLAGYLFLKNSSYFNISEIRIIGADKVTGVSEREFLSLYKGRNIFDVDINSLSSIIKKEKPFIKNAIVKRVLPDVLEIDLECRIPIALVKAGRTYPIDNTGMVLSYEDVVGDLPVISGFSFWLKPIVGEEIREDRLRKGLLLLKELKESSIFKTYEVREINVKDPRNFSFYLKEGIEVMIGGEDFSERLVKLKKILSNPDLDKKNIKYIDLRFKNAVIGPK